MGNTGHSNKADRTPEPRASRPGRTAPFNIFVPENSRRRTGPTAQRPGPVQPGPLRVRDLDPNVGGPNTVDTNTVDTNTVDPGPDRSKTG